MTGFLEPDWRWLQIAIFMTRSYVYAYQPVPSHLVNASICQLSLAWINTIRCLLPHAARFIHIIFHVTHMHTPGQHNAAPISRCIAYEIVRQQTCACVNTAYLHKLHCWKYLSNVCNLNSSFSYEHYEFTIVTIKYLVYFMETTQHIHPCAHLIQLSIIFHEPYRSSSASPPYARKQWKPT